MKDTAATNPSKITASAPSAKQLQTFKDERAAILNTPVQEPVKSTAPAKPAAKLDLKPAKVIKPAAPVVPVPAPVPVQPVATEVKQVKLPLQPRRSKVFPNPPLPQEVVAEPAPAFAVEPLGEDVVMAGAVSAAIAKVPVQTLVGNITNTTISPNFFGINRLTDGDALNSWTSSARQMLQGDVTINEVALTRQLQHGYNLNQSVLDEDRAMAVMGLDWREIQLLNATTVPGLSWSIIPHRDADKIFILAASTAFDFEIVLPTTNSLHDHYQFDGFKAMFVNLSSIDQKILLGAASPSSSDIAGHASGLLTIARGACVVLKAVPRALRTVTGCRYITETKFGTIT